VADIGGKKINKRGSFRPKYSQVDMWVYVNLDRSVLPDIVANAEDLPLVSNTIDTVLMTEVLEHTENNSKIMREVFRVLKEGGTLIGSVPFLYPFHKDPVDNIRYTFQGLESLLSNFSDIRIFPMGGAFGTIGILLEHFGNSLEKGILFRNKLAKKVMYLLSRISYIIDIKVDFGRENAAFYTSGFFFVCKKKACK
jgi:SAM-dependent methyltransferase